MSKLRWYEWPLVFLLVPFVFTEVKKEWVHDRAEVRKLAIKELNDHGHR